jgi:predicted ATPase
MTPLRDTGLFVGRSDELRSLWRQYAVARAGPGAVVVIHGEAGIGKTTLVGAFADAVVEEGGRVLWGACFEGGTVPYGPWTAALAGIDSAGLVVQGPSAAPIPSGRSQLALFERVANGLVALDPAPVLVLDDLHWASPDTLELLRHVAQSVASGLFMLLTHRGASLDIDAPLARTLAEVGRLRQVEDLALERLDDADAAALLTELVGRPLEPAAAERLLRDSAGNPFFLTEIGRELQRRSGLSLTSGTWRPPESIKRAIGLRLSGLSAQTRTMLELASLFSAGFAFPDMERLTGLPEELLLDCIDEALADEVLRPVDRDRYTFTHALVRQTLYERFSPSRRARLHRRVAHAL